MRCSRWQIEVDNQAEEGCAVAVQRHRQGWQLHHGRHLPFSLKALHGAILPQPWRRGETIYEQTADFLRNLCHHHLTITGFSGGYFCAYVRNLCQGIGKRLPVPKALWCLVWRLGAGKFSIVRVCDVKG